MYHVTIWDTKKIYKSFNKLGTAKRYCRGMGHTGEDIPMLYNYPPIAFVADDDGYCVYNPRFSKRISSSVGAAFTSLDDNLR